MIRIYSSPDLSNAYAIKNLLEQNGISAHVFNEQVNQMPGAFFRSTPDAWPEVHIDDERYLHEAKALIQKFEQNQNVGTESKIKRPTRKCPKCKEENDDSFEICWKCGASR